MPVKTFEELKAWQKTENTPVIPASRSEAKAQAIQRIVPGRESC